MAWKEDLQSVWGEVGLGAHVWANGCLVEGHKGLLGCGEAEIVVRRRHGTVVIQGEHLRVRALTRDEVWVEGCVKAVVWHA